MKKLSVLFSIVALAAAVAALVVIAARYFARRRDELFECCDCGEYCDDCCDCYEDEVDGDLTYSAELAVETSDDDPDADASSDGEAVPEE